jgi:hypothetical protein
MPITIICSILAIQAKSFPAIRSINSPKESLGQAQSIMDSSLAIAYPKLRFSNRVPKFIEEAEVGLTIWELRLTDQQKYLRWYPKGILSLISMSQSSSLPSKQFDGESKHSRKEAKVVSDRLRMEFGIPDSYKESFQRSLLYPTNSERSLPRNLYFFAYAPTPAGFKYPDPGKEFSVAINADTLAVEELRISGVGTTPPLSYPYRPKISKSNAISLAKSYLKAQGNTGLTIIEESVGLAYVFPEIENGVKLDIPSETRRPAYRIAFEEYLELFVDSETGKILAEYSYK